jgi:hypothetical protein
MKTINQSSTLISIETSDNYFHQLLRAKRDTIDSLLLTNTEEIYQINLTLTIIWQYAKQANDKTLQQSLLSTFEQLNKKPNFQDKFYLIAPHNMQTKRLFESAKQMISLYIESGPSLNDQDSYTNLLQKLITHKTQPSAFENTLSLSDFAAQNSKLFAPTENNAAHLKQIEIAHYQEQDNINSFNAKLLTNTLREISTSPWRAMFNRIFSLRLERLENQYQSPTASEVYLADALAGFYKLHKDKDIRALCNKYLALSSNESSINQISDATCLDITQKQAFFDDLFALYLQLQDEQLDKQRSLKALKKNINAAANFFGYNYILQKDAQGRYQKVVFQGNKINATLAHWGFNTSNKSIRQKAKSIAKWVAIIFAVIVAVGTAATAIAAIVTFGWPVAIAVPVIAILGVASLVANYILFKHSIYNMLNQLFIKRDLFQGLTLVKSIILAIAAVCAILSALTLGALTFTAMSALLTTVTAAVGLAAIPVVIPLVAAVIAVATVVATAALLITTACNLIKQDYHLKVINYFKNGWQDFKNAKGFGESAACLIKLFAVPFLVVIGLALVAFATYAISSSLYVSSGTLVNKIILASSEAPKFAHFIAGVGPFLVKACTAATFIIRGIFNTRNMADLAMNVGNGIKNGVEKTFDFFSKGATKVSSYYHEPKRIGTDVAARMPTFTGIKQFFNEIKANPYYFNNTINSIKGSFGKSLVVANAASNGFIFKGGHSAPEQISDVRYSEMAGSTVSSYAANKGSMDSATSEQVGTARTIKKTELAKAAKSKPLTVTIAPQCENSSPPNTQRRPVTPSQADPNNAYGFFSDELSEKLKGLGRHVEPSNSAEIEETTNTPL